MGSFKVVTIPHRIQLTLEGRFDQATTAQFIREFKEEVSKINPSEYVLEIDAGKFNVLPSDMQETLKSCFGLYQSFGFEKVLMHHEDNAILSMQVKRIAKEAGLTNFEIM